MITRIPFGLPISPQTLLEINAEPYCFVLLAYNSTKEDFHEMKFLGTAMSAYFHERCAIGMLDMTYPSNNFTFFDIVESTPSFVVKRPHRQNKMLRLFHDHLDPNHLHLMPISDWGIFIPISEVEKDLGLIETFTFLKFLYLIETTENLKVMSIYMPHYQNKRYIRDMIKGVKKFVHDKAMEASVGHGIHPGEFDDELHDEDIYKRMWGRYQDFMKTSTEEIFWNQIDLEKLMNEIGNMRGIDFDTVFLSWHYFVRVFKNTSDISRW